ncbi:MAG TPA: SRPBCC family protein [Candidatus Angelobacter sp.]|nr:SRPBCC family protein [Candidatus Angelobacter sp.]
MAIKIEKTFQINQPIDKVWNFLRDPRKVVVCVSGAEITEQTGTDAYKGAIKVKVGPSLTEYKGEVQVLRIDDAAREIEIAGKGQDVRGKGSASMKMTGKLRALPDGSTEVASTSEITVVGILAQMGARVISEVSNILFADFIKNFQQHLMAEASPADVGEDSNRADSGNDRQSNGRQGNDRPKVPPSAAKPISGISLAFAALWASLSRLFSAPNR